MWGELASSLRHANGYMVVMLIFAFFATVVFFERFIMLQFVYHIDFKKFLGNLRKIVQADDIDRAITLCKNVSHTSLPYISLKALEASETDPTRVKGVIEEEAMDFLPRLEKRLLFIPAMTLLIMLVGILGTVDGLWAAFHSVDVLDSSKKQATLSHGISASLNPTALGLIFALTLLAGFNLIKGMAANLAERLHYGIIVLNNLLVPQDNVTFLTVPSMNGPTETNPSQVSHNPAVEDSPTKNSSTSNPKKDESFDDVSIEDIKDEEEII